MKSAIRKLLGALCAASALLSPQTQAEDIDLYTGGEATTGSQANVLIVLDNSTNWADAAEGWPTGKQGESELTALSTVLSTLGDSVNVGLLLGAGSNGGYVRFAVREMNTTNKSAFTNMLNTMVGNFALDGDNDDKVNKASVVHDHMMNAAYRYFNGFARFGTTDLPSGSQLDLRDYNGNLNSNGATPLGSLPSNCPSAPSAPSATCKQPAFPNNLGGYSLASNVAATYSPPAAANGGCAKNFIIFIGNGYPNQTGSTTELADAAGLAGITNATTLAAITAAVPSGSPRIADEWARFMYNYGVTSTVDDPRSTTTPKAKLINRITTYTIDVCKDSCDGSNSAKDDANRNQAILLKSMAKVGGGKYFKSTSEQEIKNALALIFAEIQAVNSVFASASLPVSVNTQGTFENQIYVGVFRPDGGSRPRWFGNLKEYKIGRFCDRDRDGSVRVDSARALVNGMIPATLTGNATGTVTGTFSGTLVNAAGVSSAVSGTVSGTISGAARNTLAATFGTSAGTTGSPGEDLGSGAVTGTISGTGTGTGTSTFTGTLLATPSLTGTYTASDWRVGEDVSVADCGTDGSGKIARLPYFSDRNGNRATDDSGGTGFIDLQARSHWSSASTFWATTPSASGASDLPDGPEVERGAAAQRLRATWAQSATAPHQDGRKVYTCLGTCLAGAAADDKKLYLDPNAVYTTNSAVTTALAAPSGSATVSLVRSGDTVTATSTVAHGFSDGTVTIAGATPTDYNGSKSITVTDATHFTYALAESPTNIDTATATRPGGTVTVTSIVLSGTTPGTTVTATATAPGHGLSVNNATTIAGAAQAFLNGVKTVLTVAGNEFTFSVAIPGGNPSATHGGTPNTVTIKCGGTAPNETATGAWNSTTGRFTFNKSGTGNFGNYPNGCRTATAGATVTVSGAGTGTGATAADALYNGSWTVVSAGNATVTVGTLAASTAATTPDAGASKTATTTGTSFPINITRTLGSTTATAVTNPAAAHGFLTTDTISITGAAQSQYNGSFAPLSVGVPDANSFTFGPITLTPAQPTGTITATVAGASAGPDTTNLILWTRGKDLWEDEDLDGALTNVRASIHADVLHSRPAVVNYGSSIGIVGFYGANDGFLRAIHGGTASVDGEEKWAFIPSEFMNYNKLARLYKNSNLVRYPNLACSITPTPTARDYFWDGPITVYQSPDGTSSTPPSKTWLFAIMRRGGRSLYALDVTNPDTPKFMWRISNTHFNNTLSTTYAELGQTWSEPQIAKLKGTFARADATVITDPVVLVFGAGYDAAQEDKPTGSLVTPTMGRGVFVVEAETGQLIQLLAPTAGVTGYSFAADPTVYDKNTDGYVDRIYAADTNANVFRFDTDQTVTDVTSSTYWKRYHIAKVGDIDANGGANARKFLFKPEILPFTHAGVVKTMVLAGSGNREKPLNNFTSAGTVNTLPVCLAPGTPLYSDTYYSTSTANKVNDRFFGLLDAVQSGDVEATVNAAPILLGHLQQINSNTVTNNTLTPFRLDSGDRGWQILLRNDPDGNGARNEEKTVNAAKVIGGIVFFATNTPVSPNVNAGVCSNLGEARSYALDPITGMPVFNRDDSTSGGVATYTATDFSSVFAGGGLPPTAVSGTVMVGGEAVNICIGCGGGGGGGGPPSVFTPTDPSPELTGIRTRLYWSYGAD